MKARRDAGGGSDPKGVGVGTYYVMRGGFPFGLEWFVSMAATGRIIKRGFASEQAAREWLHNERRVER